MQRDVAGTMKLAISFLSEKCNKNGKTKHQPISLENLEETAGMTQLSTMTDNFLFGYVFCLFCPQKLFFKNVIVHRGYTFLACVIKIQRISENVCTSCYHAHISLDLYMELQYLICLCRCFTFGIGQSACRRLVQGLATVSKGTAEFLADGERLQPKVLIPSFVYHS